MFTPAPVQCQPQEFPEKPTGPITPQAKPPPLQRPKSGIRTHPDYSANASQLVLIDTLIRGMGVKWVRSVGRKAVLFLRVGPPKWVRLSSFDNFAPAMRQLRQRRPFVKTQAFTRRLLVLRNWLRSVKWLWLGWYPSPGAS